MAKLDLNPIFTGISGKLSKDSKITTRTRNGISHAYEIRHPFQGDPSQSQLTQRSTFSNAQHSPTQLPKHQTSYRTPNYTNIGNRFTTPIANK